MDPAASTSTVTTVEHVVLFKVRDGTDPTKIDAMVSNLLSLSSLDPVSHLTAGPVLVPQSSACAGATHLLHSRYRSHPDLAAYASHPRHLAVVKENSAVSDVVLALDWVSNSHLPPPTSGSVLQLTLGKPKEGISTADVLSAIDEIKGSVGAKAEQLSSGENISPARAKGFSVGFISVFKSMEEMDADAVEAQREKLAPLLESMIDLHYLMP